MPWEQLEEDRYDTEATCVDIRVNDVLVTSKRLLTLNCTEGGPAPGSKISGPLVQFRNETLKTLTKEFTNITWFTILPHLFPKLTKLTVSSLFRLADSRIFLLEIYTLLLRSGYRLRSLSLSWENPFEGELSSLLALCNNLEMLYLCGSEPLVPRVGMVFLKISFHNE